MQYTKKSPVKILSYLGKKKGEATQLLLLFSQWNPCINLDVPRLVVKPARYAVKDQQKICAISGHNVKCLD